MACFAFRSKRPIRIRTSHLPRIDNCPRVMFRRYAIPEASKVNCRKNCSFSRCPPHTVTLRLEFFNVKRDTRFRLIEKELRTKNRARVFNVLLASCSFSFGPLSTVSNAAHTQSHRELNLERIPSLVTLFAE